MLLSMVDNTVQDKYLESYFIQNRTGTLLNMNSYTGESFLAPLHILVH